MAFEKRWKIPLVTWAQNSLLFIFRPAIRKRGILAIPAIWRSRSVSMCFTCARNIVIKHTNNFFVDFVHMMCFPCVWPCFICVSSKFTFTVVRLMKPNAVGVDLIRGLLDLVESLRITPFVSDGGLERIRLLLIWLLCIMNGKFVFFSTYAFWESWRFMQSYLQAICRCILIWYTFLVIG